jgi:predicted TPR repeat methyltransferase
MPNGSLTAKKPRRPRSRRARVTEARRLGRAQRLFDDRAYAAADALFAQILAGNPTSLAALRGRAASIAARSRAIRTDKNEKLADALCDIADQCYARGLYAPALDCYQRVLDLAADRSDAIWGIAECYASQDEVEQAIIWYRRYLDAVPDEPEALHMLAALGELPSPDRASDGYVTAYFDRFAEDFDHQLIDELDYRVPELLYDAVAPCIDDLGLQLDILDLGCGTGLSGRLFRQHAARLDGVDLSADMLDRARDRGVYDDLAVGEIVTFLDGRSRQYDVLIAGDVLAYFGRLSGVFRSVARASRDGALFAFSVEALRQPRFQLTPSGRYAHGRPYITRLAAASGLRAVSMTSEQLRYEYGEPVMGDIWVFEKVPSP